MMTISNQIMHLYGQINLISMLECLHFQYHFHEDEVPGRNFKKELQAKIKLANKHMLKSGIHCSTKPNNSKSKVWSYEIVYFSVVKHHASLIYVKLIDHLTDILQLA